MKAIGFIIPFKGKQHSKNWQMECALLGRTLQSLLNQTDSSFGIYVVYTDLPAKPIENERIKWLLFPFAFVRLGDITDRETYVRKHRLESLAEGYLDQGKRVLYGTQFARQDGCSYVMSVDADDLISNRLVGFIRENIDQHNVGWYVDKGYVFGEGKRFLQKVSRNMHHLNGSVNIVRTDLVPEPDFLENKLENFSFFPSHGYLRDRILYEFGAPLIPIPFFATVYVRHGHNWSAKRKATLLSITKGVLKNIVRFKYLSRSVQREFGFIKISM